MRTAITVYIRLGGVWMSILVFIDESRRQYKEKGSTVTIAGAAFEEVAYDDLCRKFLRLKSKFFKRSAIGDYPLKGRRLLNNRSLESYRKIEFVREVFSLCRMMNVILFSTTKFYKIDEIRKDSLHSAPIKTAMSKAGKAEDKKFWVAFCNSHGHPDSNTWMGSKRSDRREARKDAIEHNKKYKHQAGVLGPFETVSAIS